MNVSKQIELTKELLASLGISNDEDLNSAFGDLNISNQFIHSSKPSLEMFHYAQSIIKRAKNNIIDHLASLQNYDCTEIDELATTVIGGIKKDGLFINIVIRPSDNGEVILYYSSEKDSLYYDNAELWIDNGRDLPRQLTLGEILKTIGINRIPV